MQNVSKTWGARLPPNCFPQDLVLQVNKGPASLSRSNSMRSEPEPAPSQPDVFFRTASAGAPSQPDIYVRTTSAGGTGTSTNDGGRRNSEARVSVETRDQKGSKARAKSPAIPEGSRSPHDYKSTRSPRIAEALHIRRMRRASTECSMATAAQQARMEKESREEASELGKLQEKLSSMWTSAERGLLSRLAQIETKVDILINTARENVVSSENGPAGLRRTTKRCRTMPSLRSCYGTLALQQHNADVIAGMCKDEDPPLPQAVWDSEISVPKGHPAWMGHCGTMSDSAEDLPEQPTASPPDLKQRASVVAAIAKTMSFDNTRRKDSLVSSVSSTTEQFRAKVRAMSQKRTPIQQAVWNFLEEAESSGSAYVFSWFLPILVVVNAFFCTVQTTDPPTLQGPTSIVLHFCFDIFFALEVVIRFIVCPNRFMFFTHGSNWIDMAAVIPLIMNIAQCATQECMQSDFMDKVMVILPVLRLCKLLRSFEKFHLLLSAFALAFEALPVLLYTLSMLVMFFAALIYFAEPRTNIRTLPQSLWLVMCTMSTVGYGDETPRTTSGKICTSLLIICSALYMAIPLGIVGGAFSRVWEDRDRLMLIRRTRNRLHQWGYTPTDVLELFYLYDHDKSGELDLGEFSEMIKEMNLGIGAQRIVNLFNTFDSDGSGKVDDEEFVRALYPKAYHSIYRFRTMLDQRGYATDYSTCGGGAFSGIRKSGNEGTNDSPVKDGPDPEYHSSNDSS